MLEKNDKINPDMVDAINEQHKKGLSKFRRVYEKVVSCIYCHKVSVLSDKTVGFCCKRCGKYQNAEEAVKNYEAGNVDQIPSSQSSFPTPAIKGANPDQKEYSMFRDEMEIRADMFVNDKTRENMGVEKFHQTLKKNLIKDKCYRGVDKVGI